jgi:hypothetical protein
MRIPFFSQGHGGRGPIRCNMRLPGQTQDTEDLILGYNPHLRPHLFEDFTGKATGTVRLVGTTVQTAGTPAASIRSNIADGVWRNILDATDEAQSARLSASDQLFITASKRPYFSAFVQAPTIAANQRCVWGLASAYNATLDNITYNVWFKLDGSMTLVLEADDNVTDKDDLAATSVTALTAATWYRLTIDMTDPRGRILFFVNERKVGEITTVTGWTTAAMLQPFCIIQKDSGVGLPNQDIDYVRAEWDRSL